MTIEMTERPCAVAFRNVDKRYNSHVVLNGFNMTVDEGCIYGILGPSGCGKTTALGCIVGTCGMDSGEIHLSIQDRTQLGYMPQNLGLFGELTPGETLYFNGRINLMCESAIKSRIKELSNLLGLPKLTTAIRDLSGGQQRRVSMAVTMLHDPQLLLLDEPTVGLDPVLRQSIWEHLRQLVADGNKTIIITTHYIEEARLADTVGFMMDGAMIVENSPSCILHTYRMNTLEEAFLHATSQRQKQQIKLLPQVHKDRRGQQSLSPLVKKTKFSSKRLWAEIIKNLQWFKRGSLITIYLCFIGPIITSVLLYETIGKTPFGLSIGAVHGEGFLSCARQNATGCDAPLGCRLVDNLRFKSYNISEFDSEKSGVAAITHNDVWAVISFPPNLSSSLMELSENMLSKDDALLDRCFFNITMDMSNSIIGSHIVKHIRDGYYEVLDDWFLDCGLPAWSSHPPLKFNEPVFGSNDVEFTSYVFPGLIILFPFTFACFYSMATVLVDKVTGVLERSLVAGLLWSEFLAAHITIVLVLLACNVGITYTVTFCIYKQIHHGSYLSTLTITYLQGLCGMCCGILIAVVCKMESLATQMLVTITFLCSYGTGAMWPLEGMHWVARVLSLALPTTIPLQSVRHIIDRGWPITYYPVLKGVISSILWSCFFLFIASLIMYRKIKLLK